MEQRGGKKIQVFFLKSLIMIVFQFFSGPPLSGSLFLLAKFFSPSYSPSQMHWGVFF